MNRSAMFLADAKGISSLAVCLLMMPAAFGQTTVAITGGDAGEGLTLVPADVVYAYNIRGGSFTVQGVEFTGYTTGSASASYTDLDPFGGGQNSSDDAALRSILQTMAWDEGGGQPSQVTFSGLQPFGSYKIDLLYYSGFWAAREQAIVVNSQLVDIVEVSQSIAYTTFFTVQANGAGSITLLTVNSAQFGGTGQQDGSLFNAVVLSTAAIPEPSSVAGLGAFAALTCAVARRRSRAER